MSFRRTALAAAFAAFASLTLFAAHEAAAQTSDQVRADAVAIVNAERARHGLSPLSLDATLSAAAQAHAEDMTARAYVSHTSPEGTTPADRYMAAGGVFDRKIAENLYGCDCLGTPENPDLIAMNEGWMGSPGHRQNILDPELATFGFGVATMPDGYQIAVQTFAGNPVQTAAAW